MVEVALAGLEQEEVDSVAARGRVVDPERERVVGAQVALDLEGGDIRDVAVSPATSTARSRTRSGRLSGSWR